MAQTILVVDGEEVMRDIVTSMLRSGGYECRGAQNGLDALTALESGDTVDLILSEVMMVKLDGIGLLERVRENYPSVPFAIVTSVHDVSVAEAAITLGACDYLLKPFEREQLLAVVRRALLTRTPGSVDREQLRARIRQVITADCIATPLNRKRTRLNGPPAEMSNKQPLD
jgi:DNA-binding NtrC family response regulator